MSRPSSFYDRVLVPATSRVALSPSVMALTTVFGIGLHLHGTADLGYSFLPQRVIAALMSNFLLFLCIWLAHAIFKVESALKVWGVLTLYMIGGLLRGYTLSLLLDLMQVENSLNLIGRLLTSAMAMSVAVAIATHFFTMFKSQTEAVATLNLETEKLSSALEQLEKESQSATLKQVSKVANQIVEELRTLKFSPVASQIQQIQKIINDYVRPLSKVEASEIKPWQPPASQRLSVRRRVNFASINLVSNLPSPWVMSAICFSAFPSAYAIFGLVPAIRVSLFALVVIVPSTFLGFKFAKIVVPRFRGIWAYLALFTILIVFSAPGAFSSVVALVDTADPTFYLNGGLVTFPLLALFLAVAGALFDDYDKQRAKLQQVNRDLKWSIARVNLLNWCNRGEFARLLHGPIQNALHATLIRLKNGKPETVVDGVIEELQQRITFAGGSALKPTLSANEIAESFENIAKLWDQIAEVKVELSAETVSSLSLDSPATSIVLDLCNEVCSNAIRHGEATKISIKLTSDLEHVNVSVDENGKPKSEVSSLGVGTQLLEACSTQWKATQTKTGRLLEVSIPSTWTMQLQPAI